MVPANRPAVSSPSRIVPCHRMGSLAARRRSPASKESPRSQSRAMPLRSGSSFRDANGAVIRPDPDAIGDRVTGEKQHRARRFPENPRNDASEDDLSDVPAAVGAHHEQVGAARPGDDLRHGHTPRELDEGNSTDVGECSANVIQMPTDRLLRGPPGRNDIDDR